MIYLDNAATTRKKPQEVIDAVVEAMNSMGNAGRGTHEATLKASRGIFEVRKIVAEFFHVSDPSRIVFTNNSTESLNIAIKGALTTKDHIITTVMEHNSVLRPIYELQDNGASVDFIGVDDKGSLLMDDIEKAIKDNTKAIVCTNGSNLTGNWVDIEKIGAIAKKHNLLFIVDASQTAGFLDIDVDKMNIDILCFTGHKSLLGPQGTGGMYVREGIDLKPLKVGGSGVQSYNRHHPEQMPTRLEAGTLNGHGLAGLGAAISYINHQGLSAIAQKEMDLMWQFYNGIKCVEGVTIYGDFTAKYRCPIVCLNIRDYDSSAVSDALFTEYDIATRPGAHCAPLMHTALGTTAQGAVRFSFSHFNTTDEVDIAIRAIKDLASE